VTIRRQLWHCVIYANQSGGYREAEAWLASADQIEEDWWRGQVRLALLGVVRNITMIVTETNFEIGFRWFISAFSFEFWIYGHFMILLLFLLGRKLISLPRKLTTCF
jgi:hypothetical protein